MRVAVVGGGVMGLAAAAALTRRGADVDVYEQFGLDHARGSSHGSTRIFRLAYAEPEWVSLAQEAFAHWRELERDTGVELLALDGLLELGAASAEALGAAGVAHEWLDPDATERRFRVRPDGPALLQPEAGSVFAARARHALLEVARRRGARVHSETRVASIAEVDADVVVVAAGSWARALLAGEGIALDVVVTRETVAYFRRDGASPSVIDYGHDGAPAAYALYDPEHGLKAGIHHAGAVADADEEGEPSDELVAAVAEWVGRRFADVEPTPVAVQTCLYTTTPDERFVLERHGRIVVASACSGHGFKFAPAVGERLADLALDP